MTTTLTLLLYTCHTRMASIYTLREWLLFIQTKALRRPDMRINKIQPSRFFCITTVPRGQTRAKLTVKGTADRIESMEMQNSVNLKSFALLLSCGKACIGGIYITGPPGRFRPRAVNRGE